MSEMAYFAAYWTIEPRDIAKRFHRLIEIADALDCEVRQALSDVATEKYCRRFAFLAPSQQIAGKFIEEVKPIFTLEWTEIDAEAYHNLAYFQDEPLAGMRIPSLGEFSRQDPERFGRMMVGFIGLGYVNESIK